MHTIVELSEYIKQARKLLDESERSDIISHLAKTPDSGEIIQGTGGVRKFRWSAKGKGKSGGVRVIHFYCDKKIPLFLISIFSKNEKDNLTMAECNILKKLTTELKKILRGKL